MKKQAKIQSQQTLLERLNAHLEKMKNMQIGKNSGKAHPDPNRIPNRAPKVTTKVNQVSKDNRAAFKQPPGSIAERVVKMAMLDSKAKNPKSSRNPFKPAPGSMAERAAKMAKK